MALKPGQRNINIVVDEATYREVREFTRQRGQSMIGYFTTLHRAEYAAWQREFVRPLDKAYPAAEKGGRS